jgi:N-acetylmuramoyl-L-alanine amidase
LVLSLAVRRQAWGFLLLGCLIGPVAISAQVSLDRLRTARLHGLDYIDASTWATSCQMKVVRQAGGEELLLTNRWARLHLKINSRKAEINGIVVWLSYPVTSLHSAGYISKIDLAKIILPVLFPAKTKPPQRVRVIALDPGHGGKDPGNLEGSKYEKHYNLLLAREIRGLLARHGIRVVMTRDRDTFVSLERRPAMAREKRANVFVSLHFNAASRPHNGVRGVEVYCVTPAGARSTADHGEGIPEGRCAGNRQDERNILLAYQVQKSMIRSLGMEDLGIRRARWMVLRHADMPAILLECGYMTDSQDARRIYSESQRKQMAQAIVDGILAYKRLVER